MNGWLGTITGFGYHPAASPRGTGRLFGPRPFQVGLLGWVLIVLTLAPSQQPLLAALQAIGAAGNPENFSEEDELKDEEVKHGKWTNSSGVLRRGTRRRHGPDQPTWICLLCTPVPVTLGPRHGLDRSSHAAIPASPNNGCGAYLRC